MVKQLNRSAANYVVNHCELAGPSEKCALDLSAVLDGIGMSMNCLVPQEP
jgi:hypothetical protein